MIIRLDNSLNLSVLIVLNKWFRNNRHYQHHHSSAALPASRCLSIFMAPQCRCRPVPPGAKKNTHTKKPKTSPVLDYRQGPPCCSTLLFKIKTIHYYHKLTCCLPATRWVKLSRCLPTNQMLLLLHFPLTRVLMCWISIQRRQGGRRQIQDTGGETASRGPLKRLNPCS